MYKPSVYGRINHNTLNYNEFRPKNLRALINQALTLN